MYKNYLKKNPNCPVCGELRMKEVTIRNRQLEYLRANKIPWYAGLHGGIDALFKQSHFTWACDLCILTNRAIEADVEKQLFCDNPPYLAYYDQHKVCDSCSQDFIFSKEEQQYWYEELGFWVQSVPKSCKGCRKKIRNENKIKTELTTLIRELDLNNADELLKVASLFDKIGNYKKAKQYVALSLKALTK
jgi:hypothetical protein